MINTKIKVAILCLLISFGNGRIVNSLYSQTPQSSDKGTNELELITISNRPLQSENENAIPNPRLSEVDWSWYNIREPNGAGSYIFGYDNAIDPKGNEHYRTEERLKNGSIVGEYGHTDYENHRIIKVTYLSDSQGYRAQTQVVHMENQQKRNL